MSDKEGANATTLSRVVPLHQLGDRLTDLYLTILSDQPNPLAGGAVHRYQVSDAKGVMAEIKFQEGPLSENPLNGIGVGTLLQISLDFLKNCNAGLFPSRETSCAITKLEEALFWLKSREAERAQRGVLGTHAK